MFAYINFVDQSGNPIDPDFGYPGGGGHPSHGLPGSPGHPSTGPIYPGGHPGNRPPGSYPGRPDNSLPGAPVRPDNGLPPLNPDRVWPPPAHTWPPTLGGGPGITDPDYGLDAGLAPGQPIYIPSDPPPVPGQGLPPYAGNLPVEPTEPGTVWPPIPGYPVDGEGYLLVLVVGVGFRYVKVIGKPPATEPAPPTPTHPINTPPGRIDNTLPPTPQPK